MLLFTWDVYIVEMICNETLLFDMVSSFISGTCVECSQSKRGLMEDKIVHILCVYVVSRLE